MNFNKNTKVQHRGPDGTVTAAKVVSHEPDSYWVTVKWLEARWNLQENLLVSRKGTTSTVAADSLKIA